MRELKTLAMPVGGYIRANEMKEDELLLSLGSTAAALPVLPPLLLLLVLMLIMNAVLLCLHLLTTSC
jgi:hypothetical protein